MSNSFIRLTKSYCFLCTKTKQPIFTIETEDQSFGMCIDCLQLISKGMIALNEITENALAQKRQPGDTNV